MVKYIYSLSPHQYIYFYICGFPNFLITSIRKKAIHRQQSLQIYLRTEASGEIFSNLVKFLLSSLGKNISSIDNFLEN